MTVLYCYSCGAVGHKQVGDCDGCGEQHSFVDIDVHRMLCRDDPERSKTLPQQEPRSGKLTIDVPHLTRDKMHKHFDWSLGQEITSKSQRNRLDKKFGMHRVSVHDEYRDKDKPNVTGRVASYSGQKDHKSSAEKCGVRTADGRLVI